MAVRRRLLHILLPKRKGKTRRGRNTPRNKNPLNLLERSSILSVFHPGAGSPAGPGQSSLRARGISAARARDTHDPISRARARAGKGGGGDLGSFQIIRCRGRAILVEL